MSDANIVPFQFETQEVRAIDRDGEPWFILNDVCRILEIANPRDAASRLDEDEKDGVGIADAMGRQQNITIINESGLYSLILTSRKAEAKRFKKWVTSEVLPIIRKTGSYAQPSKRDPLDMAQNILDSIRDDRLRIDRLEKVAENIGAHEDYRTIKAHAAIIGHRLSPKESSDLGRLATSLSKQRKLKVGTQPDATYGHVNTYHRDVLDEIFNRRSS